MSGLEEFKVFVYGTLKKGFSNHRLLVDAEFLGVHTTPKEYLMFHNGFPCVINADYDPAPVAVVGEVYKVDKPTMIRLDALEGYPYMYDRELINTPYGTAWIYIWQSDCYNMEEIETGEYLGYGMGN